MATGLSSLTVANYFQFTFWKILFPMDALWPSYVSGCVPAEDGHDNRRLHWSFSVDR